MPASINMLRRRQRHSAALLKLSYTAHARAAFEIRFETELDDRWSCLEQRASEAMNGAQSDRDKRLVLTQFLEEAGDELRVGLTIVGPMVCGKCHNENRGRIRELIIAGYWALKPTPDYPKVTRMFCQLCQSSECEHIHPPHL